MSKKKTLHTVTAHIFVSLGRILCWLCCLFSLHLIFLQVNLSGDRERTWLRVGMGFITPGPAICGSAVENNIDCGGPASQRELQADNCVLVSLAKTHRMEESRLWGKNNKTMLRSPKRKRGENSMVQKMEMLNETLLEAYIYAFLLTLDITQFTEGTQIEWNWMEWNSRP